MNAKAEDIHQITEFTKTEAALTGLEEKYKTVPDATTEDGYTACVEAIRELRPLRTGLDKMRLSLNADDQARIKFRNNEAKRITGRLTALEDPIKAAKVAVDTEKERIEEEARQTELKRITGLQDRIEFIKQQAEGLLGASPESIKERKDWLFHNAGLDTFEEYTEQAEKAYKDTTESLNKALSIATSLQEQKAEQERIAKEQAEQQAKLDAERKAQADEIARQKAELDAQQKKIDDERQEAARVMREAQEKAEAEKRKVEAEKLAAERAEKERLQAELDAKERAEREAKEAEERKAAQEAEDQRQEELRPDKEKVHDWAAKLRFIDGPSGVTNKQCQLIVTEALTELADISESAMKQVDLV